MRVLLHGMQLSLYHLGLIIAFDSFPSKILSRAASRIIHVIAFVFFFEAIIAASFVKLAKICTRETRCSVCKCFNINIV